LNSLEEVFPRYLSQQATHDVAHVVCALGGRAWSAGSLTARDLYKYSEINMIQLVGSIILSFAVSAA
jgi:hypothetical protein